MELSLARLQAALAKLQEEIRSLEIELASFTNTVPLDDGFFWGELVPLLSKRGPQVGSDILEYFRGIGYDFTDGSFRTFLSRQKARGRLVTPARTGVKSKWYVSDETMVAAKRLGHRFSSVSQ